MGRRTPTHEDAYSGPKAAKLAGVSYRCLDTWARKGFVVPSIRPAKGSGTYRLYSPRDVVALRVARRLREQGISLKTIAEAARALRRGTRPQENPLADYSLIADHRRVYVETADPAHAIEVSRGGQLVFTILLRSLDVGGRSQTRGRIERPAELIQRAVKL